MKAELLARLEKEAEQPAGVAPVIDSPELKQLLEERSALFAALHAIYGQILDEVDIGWHGEPNLAMRLVNEFGSDVTRALGMAKL